MSNMGSMGSEQPQLTVGSLLGVPLGSTTLGSPADAAASLPPQPAPAAGGPSLTAEEGPWTITAGTLGRGGTQAPFRADGVEAVTYDNVLGQSIEQVWFDGRLVYALDLGEVDVDANRVPVAQEYQIVYAVELDARGKLTSQERVPDQLNIYDSIPGMAGYSPIWQFNYVVVPRDYQPNTLRSERDCLAGGYPIHRSQMFEN